MLPFYTPWKQQKNKGSLVFLGGIMVSSKIVITFAFRLWIETYELMKTPTLLEQIYNYMIIKPPTVLYNRFMILLNEMRKYKC